MNKLEKYLWTHGIDPVQAMNILQGTAGVVSDNCVTAHDVAAADIPEAIAVLQSWPKKAVRETRGWN